MSVIINTNMAATLAATNLGMANAKLQTALTQLSSGSKITSPGDDAGGLAVSMQLQAAINRSGATNTNVQNATSFLQTQDGALNTVGQILNRISELKTMSLDVTKNSTDIGDYDTEFTSLIAEIGTVSGAQFNGVNLFGGGNLSVSTTEDGASSGNVSITQADVAGNSAVSAITGGANLAAVSTTQIDAAISAVAGMRATNGAETSDLGFASQLLTTNQNNLTAANSQITDVDVAQASTQLAKDNIMVQAGTSMLAQANSSTQAVLKLLQ
jgi:flagellin